MRTCKKCKTEFPIHMKIDGKARNLCNRDFCLDCSPFGKHNTKNLIKSDINLDPDSKTCAYCKEKLPSSSFYKTRKSLSSYCRSCVNVDTLKRQQRFKEECVAYKGGKCEICGYKRCMAALEFHHIDPKSKDFSFSRTRHYTLNEVVKNELDKTKLLCAVCHREEHYYSKNTQLAIRTRNAEI